MTQCPVVALALTLARTWLAYASRHGGEYDASR